MEKRRKGQVGISELPSAALYIGIAVFVVVLIIAVLTGLQTSICTQNSGVEGPFNTSPYAYAGTNPLTGDYTGCCSVVNGTDNACTTWVSAVALNSTDAGITGLATFDDFWGVLVLIVILSIVIVALYAVFPRRAGI